MTYIRQEFVANRPLNTQQLNQLEENNWVARVQHSGSVEPRDKQTGVMWLDTSLSPHVWKIYDGTDWIAFAKVDPEGNKAWGISGDKATDPDGMILDPPVFSVTSSVAESVWESVGPTGSGADNIWAAMDSILLQADWIEVLVITRAQSTTTNALMEFWARRGGSSEPAADPTLISRNFYSKGGATTTDLELTTLAVIPIDDTNSFDAQWNKGASVSTNHAAILNLVGYGFNR